MMRCCSKDKVMVKVTPGKSPKIEKELCHICPSKLSKRELEDLYFKLMQNNIDLKQSINELNEKMKYQTTKLQRILATQRTYMGTEARDCCATAKAIVQEQKNVIIDMKNANDNLKEQVKHLNMKLCSTKQFLKRTPRDTSKNKCLGKISTRSNSAKNSSTSALNTKTTEEPTMGVKSVSCQYLDSVSSSGSKSARKSKTAPNNQTVPSNVSCNQNKCRTEMKELQQKILNLQKELSKTHEEYSSRIARLEEEVVDLHAENMRVRTDKALWEHDMAARNSETSEIKKKLAASEGCCDNLTTNLNIAKGKVAELQTQVKAIHMTKETSKIIEDLLSNENTNKSCPDSANTADPCNETWGIDEYPGKNTSFKSDDQSNNDGRKCHPNFTNLPENDTCCENKEYIDSVFKNEVPNYCTPYTSEKNPESSDTRRSQKVGRCPAITDNTGRQNLQNLVTVQIKGSSGESENSNTSPAILVCPVPECRNTADTECNNCEDTETRSKKERSAESNITTRPESATSASRYDNVGNRRQSIISGKLSTKSQTGQDNIKFQEKASSDASKFDRNIVSKNDTIKGVSDTQRDNRQDNTKPQDEKNSSEKDCSCPDITDLSSPNTCKDTVSPQGTMSCDIDNSKRKVTLKNKPENGDQRPVIQRDMDKTRKTDVQQKTDKREPVDYTTEYRSQYCNPQTKSPGLQPPSDSPYRNKTYSGNKDVIAESNEKQEDTSSKMSQLVNKSNESSCYCSNQCQCMNSMKTSSPGDTAVSMFAPSRPGSEPGVSSPMSAEDQSLLQKFISLFLPAEATVAPTDDAPTRKPLTETSEQSAADTFKTADDSGFVEANKSTTSNEEKRLAKMNQELINKVADLQSQLDQLRVYVLSRKDTYTVLKDDSTQREGSKTKDSGKIALPEEYSDKKDTKYRSTGPSDVNVSCETTCVQEGFGCTKECLLNKRTVDQKNTATSNDVDDKIYQIPEPIYGDSRNKKIEFDTRSNSTHQSSIFYEGNSKGVREKECCMKEESPPKNRTLNMRNPSTSPTVQETIANINARYVKETPESLKAQYYNRPQNLDDTITKEPLMPDRYTRDPNYALDRDCVVRYQKLQEAIASSKNVDKNQSDVGKSAIKKTPVKCACARYTEYTANMLHASTAPKTCHEFSINQAPNASDAPKKFNAENVLSLNSQQYTQKKNFVPNMNVANAQKVDNTRNGTEHKPPKTPENKETLQVIINNIDRSQKSTGSDRKKEFFNKQIKESTTITSDHQNITKPANDGEINKNKWTDEELSKLARESTLFEANRIRRQSLSGRSNKVENPNNDKQNDVTFYDNRLQKYERNFVEKNYQDNSFIGNRRESHFSDKNVGSERNDEDRMQENKRRESRSIDNRSESHFEKNARREIDDRKKNERMQQRRESRSADSNRIQQASDHDNQNVEKNTTGVIDVTSKKQQEKLPANCSQPQRPMPLATSSPKEINLETDKFTDNQLGTQLNGAGDKETEQKTYTIRASATVVKEGNRGSGKNSRATSPENTDQEISSMTDLPSEKETMTSPWQSPQCRKCGKVSSGKDKTTTTSSNSATMPTSSTPKTTTFSYSEGEMPKYSGRSDKQNESVFMDLKPVEDKRKPKEKTSTEQVEQALATISEELARCRQLLKKPQEATSLNRLNDLKKEEIQAKLLTRLIDLEGDNIASGNNSLAERRVLKNNSKMNEKPSETTFALHRAEAKPHIGNGPDTPHVMFTLHIGTVVLSDEAIINSRNTSLVLTWKFYDQNVAMSHMRPGRVVNFDFSTEYDLKLTEDFLQYLKTEEMQIKVCEANKLNAPLASCSMPLREALLHTNRRADMSLALVADSRMQRRPTADSFDTRDELGVLDLWCMLRAEPRILPQINKAIAKSRPSRSTPKQSIANGNTNPLIIQEVDDQDEIRPAYDLDPTNQNSQLLRSDTKKMINLVDSAAYNESVNQMRQYHTDKNNFGYIEPNEDCQSVTSQRMNNQKTSGLSPKPRVFMAAPPDTQFIRSTATNTELFNQSQLPQKDLKRTSSGFIINQVPNFITSDEQMKNAITERSYRTGRKSLEPALHDNFKEFQGQEAIPEPHRSSYGQMSLYSVCQTEKSSLKDRDLGVMALDPSIPSLKRFWNTDETGRKIVETEPMRGRKTSWKIDQENRTSDTGTRQAMESLKTVLNKNEKKTQRYPSNEPDKKRKDSDTDDIQNQTIDITILWLALNEECGAMNDPSVKRLYVAYNFLGHSGAELETPNSLPKPKQYQDKCHFNFKKSFQLNNMDVETVGRMAKCRAPKKGKPNPNESVVFNVVSEPVEDPLGLNNCEDIGTAHLCFGDLLVYSAGTDIYTEVIPIRDSQDDNTICGVLAIRVDGLDTVRKCMQLLSSDG